MMRDLKVETVLLLNNIAAADGSGADTD